MKTSFKQALKCVLKGVPITSCLTHIGGGGSTGFLSRGCCLGFMSGGGRVMS